MQRLWQLQIGWDETLPSDLNSAWYNFTTQLNSLNRIHIKRQVLCNNATRIELHGFSDSSESAYGAAIYIRTIDEHGNYFSRLLCAKSRVAPLKKATLPRLELLAAVLLAKLSTTVQKTLNINLDKIVYYCDSTIVLAWLRTEPSKLKTFVANRISKIQNSTNIDDWKHIKSELNPVDIISRGINPDDLEDSRLWWHGPEFLLHEDIDCQTNLNVQFNDLPDIKQNHITLVTTQVKDFNIFERFSSLNKLQRVTAYCLRFRKPLKERAKLLTVIELEEALSTLIRVSQKQEFNSEIQALKTKGHIDKRSKIHSLQPFIDHHDILRVGGRLKNSQLPFEQKHPIILSKNHRLTHLIISNYHLKYLHAGVQNLLSLIRLKYWPIDGKKRSEEHNSEMHSLL